MAGLSLRTRVLLGAVLWTFGLFAVTGIVFTLTMLRYPQGPRIFHHMFTHALAWSIAAGACLVGGLWQVRHGVRSLQRLREQLTSARTARGGRVVGQYPAEVQPLVDDLNALLDHRERTVARALSKAGDLAHGLKTPLAVLAQEVERVEAAGHHDLAQTIAQQVERMRRQMDYHLAQARAAASGAAPGASCAVRVSVDGLSRTLLHLHAGRGLTIDVGVDPTHVVRVEREDLDEMLGNLLDNACKWARTTMAVHSERVEQSIVITVDDDGPGVTASLREDVLRRGVRADEAAPGSGLGLAIVRDLADAYGGSIALSDSPGGGLRACLRLPNADCGLRIAD